MARQRHTGVVGLTSLVALVTAVGFTVPINVNAQRPVTVSCSVAVDYVHDGVVADEYRQDFVVEQGVGFVDDLSTGSRQKTFTATVFKDASDVVVSIDYFSDVGVFHAVSFNTSLKIHGSGGLETTSGSNGFFASSAVTPEAVSGNHVTNYTLVCRR